MCFGEVVQGFKLQGFSYHWTPLIVNHDLKVMGSFPMGISVTAALCSNIKVTDLLAKVVLSCEMTLHHITFG